MNKIIYLILGIILLFAAVFAQDLSIKTQQRIFLERGSYANLTLTLSSTESICYNLHTESDYEFLNAELSLHNICLPKGTKTIIALKIFANPKAELGLYKIKLYADNKIVKEFEVRITENPALDFGVELNLKENTASKNEIKSKLPLELRKIEDIENLEIYVQNADLEAFISRNEILFDDEIERVSLNVFKPNSFVLKEEYYIYIALISDEKFAIKKFGIKFEDKLRGSAEFYKIPEISLDKNESKVYYITLVNLTNKFLEYKLSANEGNEFEIKIMQDSVKLKPFESKEIEFELKAKENVKAGIYEIKLYAFNDDETIEAKISAEIKSQSKILLELQPEELELFRGETKLLILNVSNEGDFVENISLNVSTLRNFDIIIKPYPKEIQPYSAIEIPIMLTAYAEPGKYNLKISVNNKDINAEIKLLGKKLKILSYPEKIYADSNSITEFNVKVYNESDSLIERAILRVSNIPDEIKIMPAIIDNFKPKETRIITLKVSAAEMESKLINAKLELVSEYYYTEKDFKIQIVGIEALNAQKIKLPPTGMLFLERNVLGILVFVAIIISYLLLKYKKF